MHTGGELKNVIYILICSTFRALNRSVIYIYIYNHKINFNVHDVFHSLNSHQHVSAAIAAIFRVMLLLRQYKGTNVVSCVSVTL